jgi:hypothetical protein
MIKFDPVSQKSAILFACKIYSGRIGWENICKMWLKGRTPEQLKGEDE